MMTRMENEYNVEAIAEPIPYFVARRADEETVSELTKQRDVEIFTRSDGALAVLFGDKWKLSFIEREHLEFTLETLAADQSFKEIPPTLSQPVELPPQPSA